MSFLFVGEERSARSKRLESDLTWKSGGLAAKPLFEALRACKIDPSTVDFINWFEQGKEKTREARKIKQDIRESNLIVVAMGEKVQEVLTEEGIPHICILHPTTPGKMRQRERYFAHVKEALFRQGDK